MGKGRYEAYLGRCERRRGARDERTGWFKDVRPSHEELGPLVTGAETRRRAARCYPGWRIVLIKKKKN